jgi:hypothetical protein
MELQSGTLRRECLEVTWHPTAEWLNHRGVSRTLTPANHAEAIAVIDICAVPTLTLEPGSRT